MNVVKGGRISITVPHTPAASESRIDLLEQSILSIVDLTKKKKIYGNILTLGFSFEML